MKKLRKKKRAANLNRALDEHDDVDDSDLVAGPAKRQKLASDDEWSEDDDHGDHEDEDGEDGEEDVEQAKKVDGKDDSDKLEKRNTRRRKQA
jgi:hypothetical protein